MFGESVDRYVIGIRGTGEVFQQPLNPFQAMALSISDTYGLVKLTILSVGKMISGRISADNLGGPIMIAQMAGEQAKAGIVNFVWFIALLSVNLGIINLFPIPVLDGGHLVFSALKRLRENRSVKTQRKDDPVRRRHPGGVDGVCVLQRYNSNFQCGYMIPVSRCIEPSLRDAEASSLIQKRRPISDSDPDSQNRSYADH